MARTQRRTETVGLGDFAVRSLGGAFAQNEGQLSRSLVQVIRYYLADRDSGRDSWPYPGFLGDSRGRGKVDVTIEIDGTVWEDFAGEARRQGIPPSQLLQHATLYFVADRDSGNHAQRIVRNLDESAQHRPRKAPQRVSRRAR